MRHRLFVIVCLGAALAVSASTALAGKPRSSSSTAVCQLSGATVVASGLPTTELINFMLTDASGTTGWVLGYTPDGTWSVPVPPQNGPTTYQFISRTWGPDGSKYTVFATC